MDHVEPAHASLDNDNDTFDTEIETDDFLAIPLVCLEIGSYCGYSAVAIASQLAFGGMLYCVELHPKCAAWTTRMVALAGLSDRVKVIQGGVLPSFLCNANPSNPYPSPIPVGATPSRILLLTQFQHSTFNQSFTQSYHFYPHTNITTQTPYPSLLMYNT